MTFEEKVNYLYNSTGPHLLSKMILKYIKDRPPEKRTDHDIIFVDELMAIYPVKENQ